jgi:phosphonopyruvate decarboxylase
VIDADRLLDRLAARGIGLATGVPCSYLTPLIDRAIAGRSMRYVAAANEGEALAVAAGAWLGGTAGLVLLQSSGLGNAVNPLTSLNDPFRIPALLVVTWRAEPGGPPDEPQHHKMGSILLGLLEVLGVPARILPVEGWEAVVDEVLDERDRTGLPVALVVRHETFAPVTAERPTGAATMSRRDALLAIRRALPSDGLLVATTGFTGRELYALGDRADQLYVVGSMGCASSLALGLALTRPERRVVCVDGDGAVLMRMGALATIGAEAPRNLLHVVLDNGCHDSTGGQATVTGTTDLAAVAAACGYASVRREERPDALADAVGGILRGPAFLHVPIRPGTAGKLPRPVVTPAAVARRFQALVSA